MHLADVLVVPIADTYVVTNVSEGSLLFQFVAYLATCTVELYNLQLT